MCTRASLIRVSLWLITGCFVVAADVAFPAGSSGPASVVDIMRDGRPANLFRTAYARDAADCAALARELNAPAPPDTDGGYFDLLSKTGGNAYWTLLPKSELIRYPYTEFTLSNIFNDGVARLVFRAHGVLGDKEFDDLYADIDDTHANVGASLARMAANGEFLAPFAVPSGDLRTYYATTGLGPAEERGLLRFDLATVRGITYILEGSFYAYAPVDAIIVYEGHPDRSFTIECAFDPDTTIPNAKE